MHQGLQAEIKIDVSVVDNLVILPKNFLRTHVQAKCSRQKKEYLSTKDVPTFMKVILKKMKKTKQQCVNVVKLTVTSKQTEKMMNTTSS